nr:immunoglobulin light chain junction region [Macaca mulatta]
CYQCYSGYTF